MNINSFDIDLDLTRPKQAIEVGKNGRWNDSLRPNEDHSEFSARFRMIKRAIEATEHQTKVRVDRVEKLRAQIEAGTYHINSEVLAASILMHEDTFVQVH